LNVSSTTKPSAQSKKGKGLHVLLRELSDDEELEGRNMDMAGPDVPDDPQQPWLHGYHGYVDVPEQVPDGWTAIQWWGVSILVGIFLQEANAIDSTIHSAIILPGVPLHETI